MILQLARSNGDVHITTVIAVELEGGRLIEAWPPLFHAVEDIDRAWNQWTLLTDQGTEIAKGWEIG